MISWTAWRGLQRWRPVEGKRSWVVISLVRSTCVPIWCSSRAARSCAAINIAAAAPHFLKHTYGKMSAPPPVMTVELPLSVSVVNRYKTINSCALHLFLHLMKSKLVVGWEKVGMNCVLPAAAAANISFWNYDDGMRNVRRTWAAIIMSKGSAEHRQTLQSAIARKKKDRIDDTGHLSSISSRDFPAGWIAVMNPFKKRKKRKEKKV